LFGSSVDISGNGAIVGAFGNDDACPSEIGCNSGAAYLFDLTTGQQLFKLTASDAAKGDNFGAHRRVGISGNRAIVGASTKDDAGQNSGAAYLFDVATGKEIRKLTASDAAAGDFFGTAVAISGNTAIVGAQWKNGGTGAAYLFDVSTGEELLKLTAPAPAAGEHFGLSVDIEGNTAIVGAPYNLNRLLTPNPGKGSVYVFDITRDPNRPGDFDNDGTVDAADYVVWRNGQGTTHTRADYNVWRTNFGRTSGSGATAGPASSANRAAPEPSGITLAASAFASLARRLRGASKFEAASRLSRSRKA
jgi:hypothetical protein